VFSSYALARPVLVLVAVNWIGLAVKKIKAETVNKCYAKTRYGGSESENITAIYNLCQGNELSCDRKNFVRSDDPLATHYNFQPATALLAVRNAHNEDVEEEEKGEEAEAGERVISTKIRTHEQALHCMSEVMQFATESNSSNLLELLYTG
jgi:hypothetical protein